MGITDGTFICTLCREWRTGCALCGEAPLLDCRKRITENLRAKDAAERELWLQEKSIRASAEARRA